MNAFYVKERLDLWDKLMAKYVAEIESKEHNPISITLPDGAVKEGLSWKTTPYDIAAEIRYTFVYFEGDQ